MVGANNFDKNLPERYFAYSELFKHDPRYAQSRMLFFRDRANRSLGKTLSPDELFHAVLETINTTKINLNIRGMNVDFRGMERPIPEQSQHYKGYNSNLISDFDQAIDFYSHKQCFMSLIRYYETNEPLKDDEDLNIEERVAQTLGIINDNCVVHDIEDYQDYCLKMCELDLEPLAYPIVLWLHTVKIFGEYGILAKLYNDFHARKAQLMYAYEICQSIFNQHMLVLEAGAGSGKSLAYLLPTILAGKSILISTSTKALQDQLYNKDIPDILQRMGLDHVTYGVIKGHSNYLCRYKADKQNLYKKVDHIIERTCRELDNNKLESTFGVLDSNFNAELKEEVTCSSRDCHYSFAPHCTFFDSYKYKAKQGQVNPSVEVDSNSCFAYAAYYEAKKRDIVIANHYLLFGVLKSAFDRQYFGLDEEERARICFSSQDERVDYAIERFQSNVRREFNGLEEPLSKIALPEVLVIDEAHTLIDAVQSYATKTIKSESLHSLLHRLTLRDSHIHQESPEFIRYKAALNKAKACFNVLLRACAFINSSKNGKFECSINEFKYLYKSPEGLTILSPFLCFGPSIITWAELGFLGEHSFTYKSLCKVCDVSASRTFNFDWLGKEEHMPHLYENFVEVLYRNCGDNDNNKDNVPAFNKHAGAAMFNQYCAYVKNKQKNAASDDDKLWEDPYQNVIKNNQGHNEQEWLFKGIMFDFYESLKVLRELYPICAKKTARENSPMLSQTLELQALDNTCSALLLALNADGSEGLSKSDPCSCTIKSYSLKVNDITPDKCIFEIKVVPLNVAPIIGSSLKALAAQGTSVILTSATLSVANNFDKLLYQFGLRKDEILTKAYESPFNYKEKSILYTSSSFPAVDETNRFKAFFLQIDRIMRSVSGGIFILTTTKKAMEEAYDAARRAYGSQRTVLMQGQDSTSNLIARFKQECNAILVGTKSFWEGVDVSGKSLSVVIIDKIPFKNLKDDTNKAIISTIFGNNFKAFKEHHYNVEAMLELNQGVGRLIRHEDDKGILIIMDPRIEEPQYHDAFLKALPPMTHVNDIEQVLEFMRQNDLSNDNHGGFTPIYAPIL